MLGIKETRSEYLWKFIITYLVPKKTLKYCSDNLEGIDYDDKEEEEEVEKLEDNEITDIAELFCDC